MKIPQKRKVLSNIQLNAQIHQIDTLEKGAK